MAVATGTAILGAAAIGAGASVIGGMNASKASQSAAQQQANAANEAAAQQRAALERQIQISEPWRTAGTTAVNQLSAMTQPGGQYYAPFSQTDWKQDPGYAFRLNEGMKALNASAAARGGLISGNALRAATGYGQELGSQEYTNAFNRYYTERSNMMDPLKFLSGQGQASAANQAANVGATAGNISNLTTGAANALAAGQIGSANAYSSALGGVGNAAQTAAMMGLYNRSSYGAPTTNFYGERAGGAAPVYDYSTPYQG